MGTERKRECKVKIRELISWASRPFYLVAAGEFDSFIIHCMECQLYSDLNAYFRMQQLNRIDSPGKLTECSQLITELQVTTCCS